MGKPNPKTLKQISVKGYTTKEGKVVRSYRALRELNLPEVGGIDRVSTETFNKKLGEIHSKFFDDKGDVRQDLGSNEIYELEHSLKSLYAMSSESGVDPILFKSKAMMRELIND